MIKLKLLILGTIILMFSACGTNSASAVQPAKKSGPIYPTALEIQNAEYGAEISQEQAEVITRAYILGDLKDPDSALFKFGKIKKKIATGYYGYSETDPIKYGYSIHVSCNAKNSYGGYTGYKTRVYLIRDGHIIDTRHIDDDR